MENKQTNKITFGAALFTLVIVGLLLWGLLSIVIIPMNKSINEMDDFCKSKGFDEATDWKADTAVRGNYVQIECDDKEIFYAYFEYECIEFDKWGNCSEKKRSFR